MKYRKKEESTFAVDAYRWPGHIAGQIATSPVRPFPLEFLKDEDSCPYCTTPNSCHGSIEHGDAAFLVCPGDYLVTISGKVFPFHPEMFKKLYEPIETTYEALS